MMRMSGIARKKIHLTVYEKQLFEKKKSLSKTTGQVCWVYTAHVHLLVNNIVNSYHLCWPNDELVTMTMLSYKQKHLTIVIPLNNLLIFGEDKIIFY